MPTSHARLFLKAILAVSAFFAGPAMALQPCPPQDELLANAKVVVEARVKSLSIGDSGLLLPIGSRMVRADLQIERVIKGQFSKNEATVYGGIFPPGPFRELSMMALVFGLEGSDTFEWELLRMELGDGEDDLAFYSMNGCNYYKFPDFALSAGSE